MVEAAGVRNLGFADLRDIVRDPEELAKGVQVFDAGLLRHLARFENKLYGEASGGMVSPYRVTIAFGKGEGEVVARCTCMAARSRPVCKHAAALLIAWAESPESFARSESPPPIAAEGTKRRAIKKGRRSEAQLIGEGIAQVNTLVKELARTGIASQAIDRADQIRALGENLREHRLRRLSARTLDLAQILEAGAGSPAALDAAVYLDLVADMLLAARRLEKHLAGDVLDSRYVEELIGKTWRKKDRAPKSGLELVEYAYTFRVTSDDYVVRASRFFDLASGEHYSEKQILPAFLAKRTLPKRSYFGRVLLGAAGGMYPGFSPFRLELEARGEEAALDSSFLERLVERSDSDLGALVTRFQESRRDPFAPDALPASVRVETVFASQDSMQIAGAGDRALYLPKDGRLEERLGAVLREKRLMALLGDVDVVGGLPTFFPLAAVTRAKDAYALEPLVEGSPALRAEASRLSPDRRASRPALGGEPNALMEIRESLAAMFVRGLGSLTQRSLEPIVVRLRELSLDKPAALIEGLTSIPDPGDRVEDFVKVHRVLEVAAIRLLAVAQIPRADLVFTATYPSVGIPPPKETLAPERVLALRRNAKINRYQAAFHLAAHFGALSPRDLVENILPSWADGSAAPHVVNALLPLGEEAVKAARDALAMSAGRVVRFTAVRVLGAVGAADDLADLGKHDPDPVIRRLALDLMGRSPFDRRAQAHVAELSQMLLSAPRLEARARAARDLAEAGAREALPALRMSFFSDVAAGVRKEAALALGALLDVDMVDTFTDQLAHRHEDPKAALLALRALTMIQDVRAKDVLLEAAEERWHPKKVKDALAKLGAAGPQARGATKARGGTRASRRS